MNHSRLKNVAAASLMLCGLSFVATGSAWAAAATAALPAGVVKGPSVEGITEYRLPNGLKVLLFPDASKPTVTVNVTYLVGSRHENYGETGMAHLLEHLMFKGSPKNKSIPQEFSNRGMDFNGTTSNDRTNYYEVFQASPDNLKWALDMEADRMTRSFISRKDLDSEMTVVRNEYESGENSPFGVLLKRMQSVAYDWHSYGRSTIGNRSDIENVKIDNLQAFYKTYYQPDNAVLLVAGKFDPAQTLSWITKSFGVIPKPKRALPPFWTVEPTQDGERSFTVRRKGDVQIVALGYKIPGALQADSDALSFMSQILGDEPTGRLHKQLVESGKAAQVFSFGMTGYAPGLQIIGAVVKAGQPLEPVRVALTEAVESFAKTPPTEEEMERTRRNFANSIEKSLNDPQQVGVALSEEISLGDWRLLFKGRDQLPEITSKQVADAAARYLKRDNRVVGEFIPEDNPQRAEIPAAPGVAEVMKDFKGKDSVLTSEVFDPSQDNINARTDIKTIGGLKVALLPKKNRGEAVSVNLSLHWGDEKNLLNKSVVSAFANEMLTRGTSKYTREQLADAFSKLKISGSPYQFDTTGPNLDAALRLVAHVLKDATFPQAEFEQLRQQWIVGLEYSRSEPQVLANEAMEQHFNHYPKGDVRNALSTEERLAEVKALKLEDVVAYHREFYGANHGELSVVGDFDKAAISKTIDESFSGWSSKVSYARILNTNEDKQPLNVVLNAPDKENGFYMARMNLDLNENDPDYPLLDLANYMFGGGAMKSRMMDRIRQKDGLSYGGGSGIHAGEQDRAGQFGMSAIAAPQNLKKLEAAIREELERALKDGFTQAELDGAKSGLLQQRVQNRSKDNVVASGWTRNLYNNRTYAWSKDYETKLKAATLAQVNAAFRKAIDPGKLSIAVAGDQAKANAPAPAAKP
ncbi:MULTISPECIES: pitrilysin family protein [unclassified Duganella]|uniref:M16 family metallopeptidase n=1 Tax=unclassified Duganella TaxID=2636909 RepID=UPI000890A1F8|nr:MULTISPECIES: pitrilysin family protein [unclassified Duganella]SDH09899.1 zinc protease [Duganella sp. OV458]SDK16265.1 zinc protease [Duganella sp. OV510]